MGFNSNNVLLQDVVDTSLRLENPDVNVQNEGKCSVRMGRISFLVLLLLSVQMDKGTTTRLLLRFSNKRQHPDFLETF